MIASTNALSSTTKVGVPSAPITPKQRNTLRKRLSDLPLTADRRGCTLSEWERRIEASAGEVYFELGAWCWWSTRRSDLSIEDRAKVVFAMLASGKTSINYEFFTAFEFGERQYDAFFEMGDSQELVQAISDLVMESEHPIALAGLQANGWRRGKRPDVLF